MFLRRQYNSALNPWWQYLEHANRSEIYSHEFQPREYEQVEYKIEVRAESLHISRGPLDFHRSCP